MHVNITPLHDRLPALEKLKLHDDEGTGVNKLFERISVIILTQSLDITSASPCE